MRGRRAEVGSTRTSPNGYHYTRTEAGWVLTHRLKAGEARGHPISPDERVTFIDGDRTNLSPENLKVSKVKGKSKDARIAQLEAKIDELQAELDHLREEDAESASTSLRKQA